MGVFLPCNGGILRLRDNDTEDTAFGDDVTVVAEGAGAGAGVGRTEARDGTDSLVVVVVVEEDDDDDEDEERVVVDAFSEPFPFLATAGQGLVSLSEPFIRGN